MHTYKHEIINSTHSSTLLVYVDAIVIDSSSSWTEDSLIKHLFMLGEVAQLCPSHISHHLCLMIQSMLLAATNHGNCVVYRTCHKYYGLKTS